MDTVEYLRNFVKDLRWLDLIDFFFVYLVVYRLLKLIRGTRAVQVLTGLGIVTAVFFISDRLNLFATSYLLKLFFEYLFLIIIILFQDEIRRALANIGRNPFLSGPTAKSRAASVLDEICKTAGLLASKRTGALIVIERQHGLKNYTEGATMMNSDVSAELMMSVFHVDSPIHDGAVIIQQGRILAAGVFFPLTLEADMDRNFGTRHRAAIAITQETDAVVIVMSEERGEISLVEYGEISRDLTVQELRKKLYSCFDLENRWQATGPGQTELSSAHMVKDED